MISLEAPGMKLRQSGITWDEWGGGRGGWVDVNYKVIFGIARNAGSGTVWSFNSSLTRWTSAASGSVFPKLIHYRIAGIAKQWQLKPARRWAPDECRSDMLHGQPWRAAEPVPRWSRQNSEAAASRFLAPARDGVSRRRGFDWHRHCGHEHRLCRRIFDSKKREQFSGDVFSNLNNAETRAIGPSLVK